MINVRVGNFEEKSGRPSAPVTAPKQPVKGQTSELSEAEKILALTRKQMQSRE